MTRFYYSTIRKLIVGFSGLFNEIKILKSNNSEFTLPIFFTTESKLLFRLRNPKKGKQISLPLLTFMIENHEPDKERQKNKLNTIYGTSGETGANYNKMYQPKAVNFNFKLSLYTKYLDDFFQVIEQIDANFKPAINISIKLINLEGLSYYKDIPVILNGVDYNTEYELTSETSRELKAVFDFTVKGELYPYVTTDQEIIDTVKIDIEDYDSEKVYRQLVIE